MKENIHPTYYKEAKVKCGCGNTFTVGSTKEKLEIEICSKCHPFYTGAQTLIDTAGRAERFRARRHVAEARFNETKARRKKTASVLKSQKKRRGRL